jgi:hypothetical protein
MYARAHALVAFGTQEMCLLGMWVVLASGVALGQRPAEPAEPAEPKATSARTVLSACRDGGAQQLSWVGGWVWPGHPTSASTPGCWLALTNFTGFDLALLHYTPPVGLFEV